MSTEEKKKSLRQQDPFLAWLQHISLSIAYGLLFMFLVANIILSQYMPEQYFDLFTAKQEVVVDLLKRGKDLPYFSSLQPEVDGVIQQYENEIYSETRQHMRDIQELERVLELNPESRDVLYALYLLYEQEGNSVKAQRYLEQAQVIDPLVGNSQNMD